MDFEYPELDDNLQKVIPAATNNVKSNLESQSSSELSNLNGSDKMMPRVDRSLKPSTSLSSGANISQAGGKILNNERDKVLARSIYPSFETVAAKQIDNSKRVKNTNLPGNLGDELRGDQKGFELSVKNYLVPDLVPSTVMNDSELKGYHTPQSRQLADDRAKLEETEKKLHDLELMKKKQEKDVADLMRMKRKLAEEVNAEKQMKEEEQRR